MKPKKTMFINLPEMPEKMLSALKGGNSDDEKYIIVYINGVPIRISKSTGQPVESSNSE